MPSRVPNPGEEHRILLQGIAKEQWYRARRAFDYVYKSCLYVTLIPKQRRHEIAIMDDFISALREQNGTQLILWRKNSSGL